MPKITNTLKTYWTLVLVIIGGVAAGITTLLPHDARLAHYIIIVLSAIIVLDMGIKMVKTIMSGSYGIDILAITAIVTCLLIGEFWAAYVIMLMLCGGEALENYADRRARRELSALIRRRPTIAHIVKCEQIKDITLDKVKVNDILLIKPGEVVPIDGILMSKSATIDESSITGESVPVEKVKGDKVVSGTASLNISIAIKATCTTKNSYYTQIIQLVSEAESQPAHFVNLANRYAIPFTLISYIIAGAAWYLSGDPTRFAEVLVVASPCPLILAAPIAFVSGMSLASRHGIIVKNGTVLERMAAAPNFCFDKTGTLTTGKLAVDTIETAEGYTDKDILAIIAAAESLSGHVMASAIINKAKAMHISIPAAKNVREVTGGGIFANVVGKRIVVGSRKFLNESKIPNLPECDLSSTEIMLAVSGKYAGAVHLSDQLRHDAKSTIVRLRQLGAKSIVMLTGDRPAVASAIAKHLKLDKALAQLTPTDKYDYVKQHHNLKSPVVMVGDGINDAPVLAAADVGITMGAMDSTVASESADAVITVDHVARVATLRQIAMHTMHIARQSVLSGMLLCLVLELIAITGVIPAILGAACQEIIDVVVILNALRVHKLRVR